MEKLNLDELHDPMKLAVTLGNEMSALADAIRREHQPESLARVERCLLLSGMAMGTILRLTKE